MTFNANLEKLPAASFDLDRGVRIIATHQTRYKKWRVFEDGVVQRLEGKTVYQWKPASIERFLSLNENFTRLP